jgi:hypothetical protein
MPLTWNDLFIDISSYAPADLLAEFEWLTGPGVQPVLLTAFGDLFVQKSDGSVWLINTIDGALEPAAPSGAAFKAALQDKAKVGQWALPGLVAELHASGRRLAAKQCYSFKHPPFLGGPVDPENVEPTDICVHLGITGQVMRQTHDLPPGTPIKLKVDGS